MSMWANNYIDRDNNPDLQNLERVFCTTRHKDNFPGIANTLGVSLKYGRSWFTMPFGALLAAPTGATFLASYPRSGNTWLKTMLVNVLHPETDSNPDIFNKVIPGATARNLLKVYQTKPPRILSTHSLYLKTINKAVYLVRDGRDCITSMYHFTTTRVGLELDFNKWFVLYKNGLFGPRWDQNVSSWLGPGANYLGKELLVVHFEDLLSDTKRTLEVICEFIGLNVNADLIRQAIDASSIDRMRKWEKRKIGNIDNPNASFYRKGGTGSWKELVKDRNRMEFERFSQTAMLLAGYNTTTQAKK